MACREVPVTAARHSLADALVEELRPTCDSGRIAFGISCEAARNPMPCLEGEARCIFVIIEGTNARCYASLIGGRNGTKPSVPYFRRAACMFELTRTPSRTQQMADNTFTLKICVVGPCRSGKTLLCRALAEQPIIQGEYSATAAVRIQEFSRQIGVDRVKVQLWDCSGSMQYQSYWSVLAKVRPFPNMAHAPLLFPVATTTMGPCCMAHSLDP